MPTVKSRRLCRSRLVCLVSGFMLFGAGCGPTAGTDSTTSDAPETRVGTSESTSAPTAELRRHTLDSDGHPLAVWEKGPPSGATATMLLLHGRTWSTVPDFDLRVEGEDLSLMNGLAASGIRSFGLDARGYGETPRDDTGWLTPDRAANDVIRVLEWMRDEAPTGAPLPVLFGWSYGSMVGQLVAQRRPELIAGLVLFGYPNHPDTVRAVEPAPAEPPRRPTTAEAAASDFIVEGTISDAAIGAYVEAALAADPVRVDWKDLHEWNELEPERVTVPTLLLEGEFDPLTDPEAHASLFTRLGTADRSWMMVPGGDHAAFLESPRPLFLEVVSAFTRRTGGVR